MNLSLHDLLISIYGNAPKHIPNNGKIIRFARGDKPHSKSCWVKCNGEMAFFNDFANPTPKCGVWKSDAHNKMYNAMNEYQKKIYHEEMAKEQERKEKEMQLEKLIYINEQWKLYRIEGSENDYFKRKQVKVQSDFRYDGNDVLIPMFSNLKNKQLGGIQRIYNQPTEDNKTKIFQYKSYPTGTFYPIKGGDYKLNDSDTLFLVEGYATGYSLMELVNEYSDSKLFTVIVCFSAANVPNVAKLFRDCLSSYRSIICVPDGDRIGINYARQAISMGADGIIDICDDGKDINDEWLSNKGNILKYFGNHLRTIELKDAV